MDSVMGTKDIIHPESMAVHVSRASYRCRIGLLGYMEWALTHPATRNPAPVVGTTWTAPVVGRAPRAAGRKVWDSFTQFYLGFPAIISLFWSFCCVILECYLS